MSVSSLLASLQLNSMKYSAACLVGSAITLAILCPVKFQQTILTLSGFVANWTSLGVSGIQQGHYLTGGWSGSVKLRGVYFSCSATCNDNTFKQNCQDAPVNFCCWLPTLHLHCCQNFNTPFGHIDYCQQVSCLFPGYLLTGHVQPPLPAECIASRQCQDEIGPSSMC